MNDSVRQQVVRLSEERNDEPKGWSEATASAISNGPSSRFARNPLARRFAPRSLRSSQVLKLGREEEEEGEDKEGWGFPALPRTQAALKAGPVPVAAAFAYLAVGGADYAEAVGMAGEGRWPEIAAYGIRHVLMYYGLGKVLNYDS